MQRANSAREWQNQSNVHGGRSCSRVFHQVGSKLNCIIKSSPSISHGISPGALTRVIRAVHIGDRQAIMVTPTRKDIEAAQGLQRLAINNLVLSINGQLREDPGNSKDDVLETMSEKLCSAF